MEKTIVLYPGLFVSHFVPMMQLADVFLEDGYAVAVALIDLTLDQDVALAAAVDRVASGKPSVTIHRLPRIHNPPIVAAEAEALLWYFEVVRRYNDRLHEFLCSLQLQGPRSAVHAVIVDAPSVAALDVAKELGVPAYTFYAANASAVAVFHQLPWIRAEGQPSFKELGDALVNFSGVPPIPASYLIRETLQDPESEVYRAMMNAMRRNAEEPDGILVNTFASLEAGGSGGGSSPRTRDASGVLRRSTGRRAEPEPVPVPVPRQKRSTSAWRGSTGNQSAAWCSSASEAQRRPPTRKSSSGRWPSACGTPATGSCGWCEPRCAATPRGCSIPARTPTSMRSCRPGSWRARGTAGLVVKHWAPQVEVLGHRATGAFVTHCGWNSALEGITAGVPMLCWPMYAEQKMNMVFMVEEALVGVEMVEWRQGLVTAGEVEAKVRLVMESVEGDEIRARVAAYRDAAAVARSAGGSSRAAYGQFLSDAAKLEVRE